MVEANINLTPAQRRKVEIRQRRALLKNKKRTIFSAPQQTKIIVPPHPHPRKIKRPKATIVPPPQKPIKKIGIKPLPANLHLPPQKPSVEQQKIIYPVIPGMSDEISIIIPHANRFDNLFICLDSLTKQIVKPLVVIISDYSKDISRAEEIPKRYSGQLNIKFVHHENIRFVRGPAINAGRPFVQTPLMFILDADIIFKPSGIKEILKAFGKKPYNRYLLSFKGYKFNQKGKRSKNEATFNKVYGAFQVYRTHDFDIIGGHNPFMTGWGWQDDDIRNRLTKMGCKQKILNHYYDHLWHPSSDNNRTCNYNQDMSRRSSFDGKVWRKW